MTTTINHQLTLSLRPGTSDIPSPTASNSGATINCNMAGGTRATAATCTGSSQIEGLGRVGSSTTLASTQIDYATLTVTAGRAMLIEASEAAANGDSGNGDDDGNGSDSAASFTAKAGDGWWILVVCVIAIGFGGFGVLIM